MIHVKFQLKSPSGHLIAQIDDCCRSYKISIATKVNWVHFLISDQLTKYELYIFHDIYLQVDYTNASILFPKSCFQKKVGDLNKCYLWRNRQKNLVLCQICPTRNFLLCAELFSYFPKDWMNISMNGNARTWKDHQTSTKEKLPRLTHNQANLLLSLKYTKQHA